ncbi:hypothetical protein HDU82_004072 [Entophlyctis luteolus]|nr:hypothetical protein HDU82_004072 [Entophlyctis luteolus]
MARVRELLLTSRGALTPASKDDQGYTPLHAAASYNHIDLMHYLLSHMALSTTTDPASGQRQRHPALSLASVVDEDGDTCLHVCETREMAEVLLAHDPTLAHACNDDGLRAIDVADAEGFDDMVSFLREFIPDYIPLAEREEQGANDEEDGEEEGSENGDDEDARVERELLHVLSAADLHQDPDGSGTATLSIDVNRLHHLVSTGQLDTLLASQAAGSSANKSTTDSADGNCSSE